MGKVRKTLTLVIIWTMFASAFAVSEAEASVPYEGYNYSYWEKAEPSAIPYIPETIIDGRQTDYGLFNSPEDVFVAWDNKIYIADSGNHRIVVLDENFNHIKTIDHFMNDGAVDTFNYPESVFVTEEGNLYVADTNNQRLIELTNDGEFIREIGRPVSDQITTNFEYYPTKVAVDKAGRIYVIGRGVYDGIIEFDPDGNFKGFTGATRVTFDFIDYIWKRISTDEQRARMELFIPIEFNSLDLDEEGFIYTTNAELNTNTPIQRLNPTGTDVLRREGYHEVVGDLVYTFTGDNAGSSTFVDIAVNEYGMYTVLDSRKGRIFTYDEDGNLLYVFGKLGNQIGTFRTPVALDYLNEKIVVLDKQFNRLTVFTPTLFGEYVNKAVMYYNLGNDELSAQYWEKVLELDSNYEIAYIGIGKALLMEGKNKEAMKYFKNGHNRLYYSKAFKRYRKDVLRDNFGLIAGTVIGIPILYMGIRVAIKLRKRRSEAYAK